MKHYRPFCCALSGGKRPTFHNGWDRRRRLWIAVPLTLNLIMSGFSSNAIFAQTAARATRPDVIQLAQRGIRVQCAPTASIKFDQSAYKEQVLACYKQIKVTLDCYDPKHMEFFNIDVDVPKLAIAIRRGGETINFVNGRVEKDSLLLGAIHFSRNYRVSLEYRDSTAFPPRIGSAAMNWDLIELNEEGRHPIHYSGYLNFETGRFGSAGLNHVISIDPDFYTHAVCGTRQAT